MFFYILYVVTHTYILYVVTHTYIFRHPELFKDVFFAYVLIVIQPLLGAVLVHSLCCNAHTHTCIHSDIRDYLRMFSLPMY